MSAYSDLTDFLTSLNLLYRSKAQINAGGGKNDPDDVRTLLTNMIETTFASEGVPSNILFTSQGGATDDADISLGSTSFGTDSYSAIQAQLDEAANGPIILVVDGHYSISQNLEIWSNTTMIGLEGCGFILRNNSNTPVIKNKNWTQPVSPFDGSNIADQDIIIENVIFNHNGYNTGPGGDTIFDVANGGSAVNGSAQLKRICAVDIKGVERLTLRKCTVYGARFLSTIFANIIDLTIEDFTSDHGESSTRDNFNYDGLHVTGTCFNVTVRGVRIRNAKDDNVSFVAGESNYLYNNPDEDGPIENVNIQDVVLDSRALGIACVSLNANSPVRNFYVNGVTGQTNSVWFRTWTNDTGSAMYNINVENVKVKVLGGSTIQNYGGIANIAGVIDVIRFKNIVRDDFTFAKSYFVTDETTTSIGKVEIDGVYMKTTGGTWNQPFFLSREGTVSELHIRNYTHIEATSQINAPIVTQNNGTCSIGGIIMEGINVARLTNLVVNNDVTSTSIGTIQGATITYAASTGVMFSTSSTIANLFLSNILIGNSSGSISSGTFSRKYGGGFIIGPTAKASLPSAAQYQFCTLVTDESGGAVSAFSDGTNWRRVTDRNIVS